MLTVLRLNAKNFDVVKFLKTHDWKVERYWEENQIDKYKKRINTHSGFNYCLCESKEFSKKNFKEHISRVIKFIKKHKVTLNKFKNLKDVSLCIDLGITNNRQNNLTIGFCTELIDLASKHNIELVVSVYP